MGSYEDVVSEAIHLSTDFAISLASHSSLI